MDIEKIKAVQEFKSQCKRYGVTYPEVAKDCDYNVDSFQTAMQTGSISRNRINKAFRSLKEIVEEKDLTYHVREPSLDPNSSKKKVATANA